MPGQDRHKALARQGGLPSRAASYILPSPHLAIPARRSAHAKAIAQIKKHFGNMKCQPRRDQTVNRAISLFKLKNRDHLGLDFQAWVRRHPPQQANKSTFGPSRLPLSIVEQVVSHFHRQMREALQIWMLFK